MSNNLAKLEHISIISAFAEATNHNLIIQTAVGQYVGKLYTEDDSDDVISTITREITETRTSEFDENNPTAIFLVDVELYTSTTEIPTKIPFVCLFLDQVTGITFGTFKELTD